MFAPGYYRIDTVDGSTQEYGTYLVTGEADPWTAYFFEADGTQNRLPVNLNDVDCKVTCITDEHPPIEDAVQTIEISESELTGTKNVIMEVNPGPTLIEDSGNSVIVRGNLEQDGNIIYGEGLECLAPEGQPPVWPLEIDANDFVTCKRGTNSSSGNWQDVTIWELYK